MICIMMQAIVCTQLFCSNNNNNICVLVCIKAQVLLFVYSRRTERTVASRRLIKCCERIRILYRRHLRGRAERAWRDAVMHPVIRDDGKMLGVETLAGLTTGREREKKRKRKKNRDEN